MTDDKMVLQHSVSRRSVIQSGLAMAGSLLLSPYSPAFARKKHLESDHVAEYVLKLPNGKFFCQLCPNGCVRDEGETGMCRARGTRNGKYRSLVYGLPCVMALDPVEKMPIYHFHTHGAALSISTAGCNLHCHYCQNWQFSQKGPTETRNFPMNPEKALDRAVDSTARSIAFFYTEPIIYIEYMKDVARGAQQRDLRTIMVTAGFINEQPLTDLLGLIDIFVVGLKGFSQDFYSKHIGGKLATVQNTMKRIKDSGKHLEVVTLLVPTLNDDLDELKRGADWFVKNLGPDVPWHFSRFVPEFELKNLPPTPTNILDSARKIAMAAGVKYAYTGNNPGQEGNHTYCPKCKNLVIERLGFQVLKSRLKKGVCPFCQTKIPGIWLDDLPAGNIADE